MYRVTNYINSKEKVANAFRSEENQEITLGAKNEKKVAVKYIIPKDIAPNDSIHYNDTEMILQMGTTKFCTVFDPKIRFQ